MVANHGTCAVAAMVNSIGSMLGKEAATLAMEKWKLECPRVKGLKSIAILLHSLEMNLSVEIIGKVEMPIYKKDAFAWLANQTAGIWIVRVVRHGLVDHVVALDGDRQLILDSAARYPFHLSEKLLREVGGSNVRDLRVAEVRKLVSQPVKTLKRIRHM